MFKNTLHSPISVSSLPFIQLINSSAGINHFPVVIMLKSLIVNVKTSGGEKRHAAASVHLSFIRIYVVALEVFTIPETLTKN